jgi:hypothetical protein
LSGTTLTYFGSGNMGVYYAPSYLVTALVIDNGITGLFDNAFSNFPDVNSVTVRSTTPPSLGSNVFLPTPAKTLYVPASAVGAYQNSAWRGYFSNIVGY